MAFKMTIGKTRPGSDLGSPSDFGGPPAPAAPRSAAPAAASALDPDQDGDIDQAPAIPPEAVNYHDDAQSCSTCQYMDDGGNCAVLQMQVQPDGGCNAFSGKDSGDQDDIGQEDDDGTGAAPPAAPMGGGMPSRGGYGS
jgi:hypothetical protein